MKTTKLIQIIVDNYDEQQYLLSNFPEAYWFIDIEEKTRFQLPASMENDINIVLNEWQKKNERNEVK
jgi:hypothetical protein